MTKDGDTPRNTARGRPSKRDAVLLRERLLSTALEEFLQNGYAGTSIDGVARTAGVSRTTIYALYRDKETLFTEMIRNSVRGADIAERVAFDERPPSEVLAEALLRLNRVYYRVPNLDIIRLCIGEADRFPELAFGVREVLSNSLGGLTAYLLRLRDQGRLRITDCDAAARLFKMLALGTFRPLLVNQKHLTEQDREGHLTLALDIFLRGTLCGYPPGQDDGSR